MMLIRIRTRLVCSIKSAVTLCTLQKGKRILILTILSCFEPIFVLVDFSCNVYYYAPVNLYRRHAKIKKTLILIDYMFMSTKIIVLSRY